MNLATTITMYGGGPGSGCNPEAGRCGRPAEGGKEHGLTSFLKQVTEAFPNQKSYYGVLYENGHAGVVDSFSKEEREFLKTLKPRGGCRIGQCYMNAQRMATRALDDPRVKYMEGLVSVHGVPISHAWIEFNGKVYDPTLKTESGKGKTITRQGEKIKLEEDKDYFGVEVPKDLIMSHQLATERYAPLTKHPDYFKKIYKKR